MEFLSHGSAIDLKRRFTHNQPAKGWPDKKVIFEPFRLSSEEIEAFKMQGYKIGFGGTGIVSIPGDATGRQQEDAEMAGEYGRHLGIPEPTNTTEQPDINPLPAAGGGDYFV